MPTDPPESEHVTKAGSEPAVSLWRWVLALLVGFAIWALLDALMWNLLDLLGATGYAPLGALISIALAILVFGRLVGARSVRRWLTVGLVAAALAAIVFFLALSVPY